MSSTSNGTVRKAGHLSVLAACDTPGLAYTFEVKVNGKVLASGSFHCGSGVRDDLGEVAKGAAVRVMFVSPPAEGRAWAIVVPSANS